MFGVWRARDGSDGRPSGLLGRVQPLREGVRRTARSIALPAWRSSAAGAVREGVATNVPRDEALPVGFPTQWRAISAAAMRAISEQGEDAPWHCSMRWPGATCKSTAADWAAIRRRHIKAGWLAGPLASPPAP